MNTGPPVEGVHTPDRPSWGCRSCRQPWPCPVVRVRLLARFGDDRKGLAVQMATYLVHALSELADTPDALFDRFVTWTQEGR